MKTVFGIMIPLLFFLVIVIMSFTIEGSQQFSDLASSLLHGHTSFLVNIGTYGQDPVNYHGKVYWSEGPFPAIPLIPFVAIFNLFHLFYYQGYLDWILIVGVAAFVYLLARRFLYSKRDSLFLMLGFCLGSVFIGISVVSSSWLYAQVLTTFLLFWSLYEYFSRRRWWLLGSIAGLLFLTRVTAAPIGVFFLLELIAQKGIWQEKIRPLLQLGIPFALAIGLMGLYNYLRFHSPLNNGSEYQLLSPDSAEARSYGVFSLVHVPTNLYSLLFRAPQQIQIDTTSWSLKFPYIKSTSYGMSIFFTSPYLLQIFTNPLRSLDGQAKRLLAAIALSTLMVLTYFGLGLDQYGYRYSLDFLPPLYVLFMMLYKKHHDRLTRGMKVLLIGAAYFNFFLVWSFVTS